MHFVIFPIHLIFMRKSPIMRTGEKSKGTLITIGKFPSFFVILRKREALWYREFLKAYHYWHARSSVQGPCGYKAPCRPHSSPGFWRELQSPTAGDPTKNVSMPLVELSDGWGWKYSRQSKIIKTKFYRCFKTYPHKHSLMFT